jgi:hypothetical protein
MQRLSPAAGLVLAVALLASLAGCHGQTSAPSPQLSRVDSIIKSSGGDWNKVSPADRAYLITTVGKGSPISAQMTFSIRAGRMNPAANIHH